MSMGDADAKFPGQHTGIAPSPTRENPGQVYPKSDPNPGRYRPSTASHPYSVSFESLKIVFKAPREGRDVNENVAATAIGNPFLMGEALEKVNEALDGVITILESEERSQGRSTKEDALLRKFNEWKKELFLVRSEFTEQRLPPGRSDARADSSASGGLFTD